LQDLDGYTNIINNMSKQDYYNDIISNEPVDILKVQKAGKIIAELQKEMKNYTDKGAGPFLAAIYDEADNLVIKTSNSVINDSCSHNHAEVNAIKEVEKMYGTYDLSKYNLSLYITAEPCMMCIGAIMWSGIKQVYYGIPSKTVENITGFDEGFKPDWLDEFRKRGITVYGNIAPELGEQALKEYISSGNKVYKPER